MDSKFEMSMIGELHFFLGCTTSIKWDYNMIIEVYKGSAKKINMEDEKPINTPIRNSSKLHNDEHGTSVMR